MLSLIFLTIGCAHLGPTGSHAVGFKPPAEAVIGWRLVPGQTLSYAHRTRLLRGEEEVGREEHWSYLVKEVDAEGVTLLEGRLTGFGSMYRGQTGVVERALIEEAEDQERTRLEGARVWVRLSQDGQVQGVEGLSWEDSLSHTLLGLGIQKNAVSPGDTWSDPAMIFPFLNLVSSRVAVLPSGTQSLLNLGSQESVFADIQSEGSLVLGDEDVPHLVLQGQVRWDLQQGVIDSRQIVLSLRQYDSNFGSRLFLEIERQH
jgi:hypothetical protein